MVGSPMNYLAFLRCINMTLSAFSPAYNSKHLSVSAQYSVPLACIWLTSAADLMSRLGSIPELITGFCKSIRSPLPRRKGTFH